MRRCMWLLAIAWLIAGCGPSVNVDQERTSLLQVDKEWSETTKDLDKFLSYYTADASVYPQGMPIATGSTAVRSTFTQVTSMPGFALRWTASKADVSGSGDIGYTTGMYEMTMNDPTGKPMTEKGKYITIWKKQSDGRWKAAEDIFNADAPPPPPPPPAASTSK